MAAPTRKENYQDDSTPYDLSSLARTAGQGLSFGSADEIEAFLATLKTQSRAKDPELFRKTYEDNLTKIREDIDEFRKTNPVAAYGSEILGSIPTSIISGPAGAASTVAKLGRLATQGGFYGAAAGEEGQRLESGIAGAAMAPAIALGASKTLPKISDAAKALMKEGVVPSAGQAFRGSGTLGSMAISELEDLTTSFPIAGLATKAARTRALQDFNNRALNNLGKKLNIKLEKGSDQQVKIEAINDAINNSYSRVLGNLTIKNAKSLTDDLNSALVDMGEQIAPEDRIKIQATLNALVNKNIDKKNNVLSGDNLNQARIGLNQSSRDFSKLGGFNKAIADYYDEASRILEKAYTKDSGKFADELKTLNSAYREFVPIQRAQIAAITGDLFTPVQLLRGMKANDPTKLKKDFASGDLPDQKFTQTAQKVLGNQLPDSMTASRLLGQDVIGKIFTNPLEFATDLLSLGGIGIPLGLASSRVGKIPVGVNLLSAPGAIARQGSPAIAANMSGPLAESLQENATVPLAELIQMQIARKRQEEARRAMLRNQQLLSQ